MQKLIISIFLISVLTWATVTVISLVPALIEQHAFRAALAKCPEEMTVLLEEARTATSTNQHIDEKYRALLERCR